MYQENRDFLVKLYRVTRREGCTMRHNGWMLIMALLGAFLLTGCRATKEVGLEASVSTETIMAEAVGEALPTTEEILPAAEETSPVAEETSPAAEETLPEIETGRFIRPGIKSPMLEPTTQAIGEDPELIEPTTVASGESPSYLPLE